MTCGFLMTQPAFGICENKAADQLCGSCTADQRLCFRYISLLAKSEIARLLQSSVIAQPGLCLTWSEIPKTRFLTTWLIFSHHGLAHMSPVPRNLSLEFMTRSATNQSMQQQKLETNFTFRERPFYFYGYGGGGAGRCFRAWVFFSSVTRSCLFICK